MENSALLKIENKPVTNNHVVVRLKAKGEYKKALSEGMIYTAIKIYAEKNNISISDEELQSYADKKRKELGLFSTAETEKYLSSLGISIDQWADNIEEELLKKKVKEKVITEDVINSYYNENKLRFMCVPLHKIIVKDKAMVEEIKLQIEDEDEEFEALAKKYSLDKNTAASGGYMGVIQRGHLPVEIESQIFAAQENEILGPFQEDGMYSIYKTGKVVNPELDSTMKENITAGLFDLWTNNLLGSLKIEAAQ